MAVHGAAAPARSSIPTQRFLRAARPTVQHVLRPWTPCAGRFACRFGPVAPRARAMNQARPFACLAVSVSTDAKRLRMRRSRLLGVSARVDPKATSRRSSRDHGSTWRRAEPARHGGVGAISRIKKIIFLAPPVVWFALRTCSRASRRGRLRRAANASPAPSTMRERVAPSASVSTCH